MTTPQHLDTAGGAASASLKATVAGASTMTLGGFTANNIAIVGGVLLGVAGFLLQWHYQRRRDDREEAQRAEEHAEHLAKMQALKEAAHVD